MDCTRPGPLSRCSERRPLVASEAARNLAVLARRAGCRRKRDSVHHATHGIALTHDLAITG